MKVVNKKLWVITITLLVVIECVFAFLSFKSYSYKEVDVIEESELTSDMFAMFLEQNDGTYKAHTNNNYFPNKGYKLNFEKSNCIDNKGNEVKNVLYFDNITRGITVTSNKTVFCYLYYDKWDIYRTCNNEENMFTCTYNKIEEITLISNVSEQEVGGMYRYQGSAEDVVNNYVCFGTVDRDECINNTELYMYRILGITSDGFVKLIKKERIDTTYAWNLSSPLGKWIYTDAYKGLNGDDFLNNEKYFPDEWENKVLLRSWKYGQLPSTTAGTQQNGIGVYNVENAWTESVEAKIGLMYIHDYYLAVSNEDICLSNYDYTNCTNSFINLKYNDSSVNTEWSMVYWGEKINSDGVTFYHCAYYIYNTGRFGHGGGIGYYYNVRPVFYLENTIKVIGGNGTIENPYIIS